MSLCRAKNAGFNLIELMVVVAIIGILAAIAIPSYNDHIQNGKRAEGTTFALDIASRQERHFTQYSRYANSFAAIGAPGTNNSLALANGNMSENGNYTAAIATDPANGNTTYTISVVPIFTDAECGVLTLTNTGRRNAKNGAASSDVVSECWR